jgi:hypothetical protein
VILMLFATINVALNSPSYMFAAFNPISLNFLMAIVSVIGLTVMKDLPRAGRCLRKKPRSEE